MVECWLLSGGCGEVVVVEWWWWSGGVVMVVVAYLVFQWFCCFCVCSFNSYYFLLLKN